jgi:hypothetical protein
LAADDDVKHALGLALGCLGEGVHATSHGLWTHSSRFSTQRLDGNTAIVTTNDDLATRPCAAWFDLTGRVGIPLGRPAIANRVFIHDGHVAHGGVGLACGHGPMVFPWQKRGTKSRSHADAVVVDGVVASRAAKDALIRDDLLLNHEPESIVG